MEIQAGVSHEVEKKPSKRGCILCAFVYDEAVGLPDDGIPPGTPWQAIPESWTCPDCGASKADFEMVEM
jgi:rubredoxin